MGWLEGRYGLLKVIANVDIR